MTETRTLVVGPSSHTQISPSNYTRTEHCTASVPLCAGTTEAPSSADSRLGTAAHAVLEHALVDDLETYELLDFDTVKVEDEAIEVDQEMRDNVGIALDFIRTSPLLKGRKLAYEQRIVLPETAPLMPNGKPMGGKADVATKDSKATNKPAVVIDYKNGFNFVEANADQLGIYLWGTVYDILEGVVRDFEANPSTDFRSFLATTVGHTVVIQPNAGGDPCRVAEWTWGDLLDLRDRVLNTLRRVKEGDFTYQFGDHCRFCAAAGVCSHLRAVAIDPVLAKIVPTPELIANGDISQAQLAYWYGEIVPLADQWIKKVTGVVEQYLKEGGKLRMEDGTQVAKLVIKKSNRRWKEQDEEKVAAALKEEFEIDPWSKRKLISPAQAEKLTPKAKREAVGELAEKPPRELTIAPMKDKRAEIDVVETLQAAAASTKAQGFLASARNRLDAPSPAEAESEKELTA